MQIISKEKQITSTKVVDMALLGHAKVLDHTYKRNIGCNILVNSELNSKEIVFNLYDEYFTIDLSDAVNLANNILELAELEKAKSQR